VDAKIIIMLLAFTLSIFVYRRKTTAEKNEKIYVKVFETAYEEDGSVLVALEKTIPYLRSGGKEEKAVRRAILHINNSILKDYKTGFLLIEKTMKGKTVKELHAKVLQHETEKAQNRLLLVAAK
jgi:hypothetical protein